MIDEYVETNYYRIGGINIAINWEKLFEVDNFSGEFFEWQFHPLLQAYEIHDRENPSKEKCDVIVNMLSDKLKPISNKQIQIFNQFYYEDPKNYIYEIRDMEKFKNINCRVNITKEDKFIIDLTRSKNVFPVLRIRYLGSALQQIMPYFNGFVMHGSGLEVRGKGVIFTGFSGMGKTTQARMWRRYRDAIIINGDSPLIRQTDAGIKMYGTPWCGTSGESVNRAIPMGAVVLVTRSKENYVEQITGDEAVMAVYTSLFYFSRNREDFERFFPVYENIVRQIKVYRLHCNMEENAVDTLDEALKRDGI